MQASRRAERADEDMLRTERHKGSTSKAIQDLARGAASYRIWTMLAWLEIKQRYRRSILGPLWLTLSTGIMILAMGPLYGQLFGQSLSRYFLYLSTSIIVWQLIATILQESCQAFIGSEAFIKQSDLPLSIYVLRVVWKNVIVFFHNAVIIFLVVCFFPPDIGASVLLFIPGVILVALNGVWLGIVVGLLCARFRDISQIVVSIVGVAFFMTPIMWYPKMLGEDAWKVNFNPFYHFIEIVRAPIIGDEISPIPWAAVVAITFAGFAFMIVFFGRYRSRISYWL